MLKNYSSPTKGLKVARYFWGFIITGTRDALVAHGYAQDGPFPGDPGANKCSARSQDPEGRPISLKRKSKHLFAVWRDWSDEEAEAYRVAEDKRRAHQQEIERATRIVESWPASADKFRDDARRSLDVCLRMFTAMATSGAAGGYRFDDDADLRFKLLGDQMRALVESGKIVKDLQLREEHTPACIAGTVRAVDAAKRDKTFQQFVGKVSGGSQL